MTSRLGRMRSPVAVMIAILVAGVLGATIVYRSGAAIREQDRAAYLAWERTALPAAERARAMHDELPSLAARADERSDDRASRLLVRTRATLEDAREIILAATLPRVLRPTVALYLEAIARDLRAVAALEELVGGASASRDEVLARYEQAYDAAGGRYDAAEQAHARLRARLRLDR